jgi:hypothetical protein
MVSKCLRLRETRIQKRLTMHSFPPIEFAIFARLQSSSTPVDDSTGTGGQRRKMTKA